MKSYFLTICISFNVFFYGMSCTDLKNKSPISSENRDKISSNSELSLMTNTNQSFQFKDLTLSQAQVEFKRRKILDDMKFAASLEREIFRVILSEDQQRLSQFEVLALAAEQYLNIKSGKLLGYECQKLNLTRSVNNVYLVQSYCLKKPRILAEITLQDGLNQSYSVKFFNQEWLSLIGGSAQLTNGNRVCVFTIDKNQLQKINCENTLFNLNQSSRDTSLQDLRIQTFEYSRNSSEEVRLVGGFYKDLIEIKKIKLTVPLQGRIKYQEKKLKIKDDFADMQKKLLGEKDELKQENTQNENTKSKNTEKNLENTAGQEGRDKDSEGSTAADEQPTQNPNSGVIDSNAPTYER